MLGLEVDEEVNLEPDENIAKRVKLNPRKGKNQGTGLKILTPNKLSTRLPILLAQIKAVNNSTKLKNEMRQILYPLYQHNKITKNIYSNKSSRYNNGRKHDCNKISQNFLFSF